MDNPMHGSPQTAPSPRYHRERRYPLEPLERLIVVRLRDRATDPRQVGDKTIAAALGEHPTTLVRARRLGLRREAAERLAEAAGFVPYEVWPEVLEEEIAAVTRTCEADDCSNTFLVSPFGRGGRGKRFCHDRCRARMKGRRVRSTAAGREANRLAALRYRDEVRAAQMARAQRQAAA